MAALRLSTNCLAGSSRSSSSSSAARRPRAARAARAAPRRAAGDGDERAAAEPEEDLPPWARNEGKGGAAQQEQGGLPELPYGVYLLVSCWFLIAGTGTVFEYAYKEPLFGVLPADSFLYAPASGVLFLGALLGAGKTWFTATRLANAENERDGYGQ